MVGASPFLILTPQDAWQRVVLPYRVWLHETDKNAAIQSTGVARMEYDRTEKTLLFVCESVEMAIRARFNKITLCDDGNLPLFHQAFAGEIIVRPGDRLTPRVRLCVYGGCDLPTANDFLQCYSALKFHFNQTITQRTT
jgi:hypothetical protein